jgi:3-isopropylmalate/(R)-2-methylmalate dehydratase small subunit
LAQAEGRVTGSGVLFESTPIPGRDDNNCFQNGILPVVLKADEVLAMMQNVLATPGYQLTVDLGNQTVTAPDGASARFEIDPFRKDCLYRGLDAIGLTLQQEATITSYEARRKTDAPWLFTDLR